MFKKLWLPWPWVEFCKLVKVPSFGRWVCAFCGVASTGFCWLAVLNPLQMLLWSLASLIAGKMLV